MFLYALFANAKKRKGIQLKFKKLIIEDNCCHERGGSYERKVRKTQGKM